MLYGDILINIDLKRFIDHHKKHKKNNTKCIGTLAIHPNDHPHDSDLVEIASDSTIKKFLSKPHSKNLTYRNLVNAATYILSPKICQYIKKGQSSDFGKEIFPKIIQKNKHLLYTYNTPEYMKDAGTPKRLEQVRNDVKTGRYAQSTLSIKKPAIFIDRDGVINEEVNKLSNIKDFKFIEGCEKAVKKINKSKYYAVVITNQPVVAKGFCTLDDIINIHKKMETKLGRKGAKLDRIYFCPHHPEKGFEGENKKYKISCKCRKPQIGLIKQAEKDLNIDLKNCYFIGDSTTDALTAKNAGIKFIGVKTGYACKDNKFSNKIDLDNKNVKEDLLHAINHIL